MRLIDVDELLNDLIFPTEQFKIAFTQMLNDAPAIEAEPFNCSLEEFGECSYKETGCSDCKVKEKVRNAIDKAEKVDTSTEKVDTSTEKVDTSTENANRSTDEVEE